MALARKWKIIALLTLALVGLGSLIQTGWYLVYKGYSEGTRSGYLRKISVKGPPYCKYLSGEMALSGSTAGQPPELWEFSVDDHSDASPLVKALHEAQRKGGMVTLKYRQDLKMWWRCTPYEYYVTGVEQ